MGKRSRKRGGPASAPESQAGSSRAGSSRAERDAARARRAQASERRRAEAGASAPRAPRRRGRPTIDERPPAPWGKFPLVELVVLLAIVLFVWSFFVDGQRGTVMLTAALAIGSLAGLELSVREHFAGYRSHSLLLGGVAGFAAMAVMFFAGGRGDVTRALMVPVGGVTFVAAFWLFREAFKRRSGGLGFR
jgi:hypothetical protein